MNGRLDKDQIDELLKWYSADADRAMFHVELKKCFVEAELGSGFPYSHVGRVAHRMLRDSDEALILFLARCWEETASDNLRRLKNAILEFGNEPSIKKQAAQGIQEQIKARFPKADEKEAEESLKGF